MRGLLPLLRLPAFADGFAAVGRGVAVAVFNGGGGVGCLAAVGLYAGKVHHQPFGGFDVFADFIWAHPEGVVFFVGGFKGVGLGFDEEFFAVSVYGEVFELGLGLGQTWHGRVGTCCPRVCSGCRRRQPERRCGLLPLLLLPVFADGFAAVGCDAVCGREYDAEQLRQLGLQP